jgi:acetyl esterase/lipase
MEMPSLSAQATAVLVGRLGPTRSLRSAAATRARIAALQVRPARHAPPKRLDRKVEFSVDSSHGWPLYTVRPRGAASGRRALYCHGGAWFLEIMSVHWQLISRLADATGTQFSVPIYPLLPAGSAAKVIPEVTDVAAELLDEAGGENVTLLGDSAGGAMALAVALQIRDRGLPAPHAIILISPALDLAFSDPAIADAAPSDPVLGVPGLRAVGPLWCGGLSLDDPLVSPLCGELRGLAPITLFSGTRDVLNADARQLVNKAAEAQVPLDYHEAPGLCHVYPLLPIPEAREAQAVMERVLRE